MPYTEKNLTADISKHIKKQLHPFFKKSFAVEYKVKQDHKPLNYKNDFQPQQLPKLYQTKHQCVYKKLSDLDPTLKPYDAFNICNSNAFVACLWYSPRTQKRVFFFDIDTIYQHKSINKSIKYKEAPDLADFYVII